MPQTTLEVANQAITERLEYQKAGIERVETKITLLLGFAVVGAQFVLAHNGAHGWWTAASVAFYGAALVAGILGVSLYEHEFPPDPARLVDAYLDVDPDHLLDVLVRTRAVAFYKNTEHATFKRRAWFATLGALVLAVALTGVSIWRHDAKGTARRVPAGAHASGGKGPA